MEQATLEKVAANLRIERALLDVLNLLEGLPIIVFKGPLLTKQIYSNLSSRESCDNDIWVRPEYCGQALQRLLDVGYLPLESLDARSALERAGQVALWPGGDLGEPSVDLHCQPFSAKLFRVNPDFLEQHVEVIHFHGVQLVHFTPALAMAHLCAHAAQHFFCSKHKQEVRDGFLSFSRAGKLTDFEMITQNTCGSTLAQVALLWSGVPPLQVKKYLRKVDIKATLITSFLRGPLASYYISRQLCVVALTLSLRSFRGIFRAVFPSLEELRARYHTGKWRDLQWIHLKSQIANKPRSGSSVSDNS